MTTCCLNTSWSLVGMMTKGQRHSEALQPNEQGRTHDRTSTVSIDAHSLQPTSGAHVQQASITTDQCESSTYQRWFECPIGLSIDEAIALGLARRMTWEGGRRGWVFLAAC
jgi:hypothetical protein